MISPKIESVAKLFDEAELALKKYERIGLNTLSSVLNELRYAGQHLIAAEASGEEKVIDEHLYKAERHCVRAKYDAKESTILALLKWIAHYRELGLTTSELEKFVPDWRELLRKAEAARKTLEEAGHAKDEDSDSLDSTIVGLLEARERLIRAEPEILEAREGKQSQLDAERQFAEDENRRARIEAEEARTILDDRRYWKSMTLAWLGIVIGVFGLAATIYGIIITLR